jgi:twitching motility protein PilI
MSTPADAKSNAFQHLLLLEERVRLSGSSLPNAIDHREQWSGIRFRMGTLHWIVRIDEIAEILVQRQPTRLPGCAAWVTGVVNLRGRLLPVFALPDYFLPEHGSPNRQQGNEILVVEKGRLFCGIVVDEIQGMEKHYAEDFVDLNLHQEAELGGMRSVVRQTIQVEGVHYYKLEVHSLAAALLQLDPRSNHPLEESASAAQ